MTGKPWLEEWRAAGSRVEFNDSAFQHAYAKDPATAKLISAAPAMARALCRLEYGTLKEFDNHPSCPWCETFDGDEHDPDCGLDAALTSAGLDTAAREEVRRGK